MILISGCNLETSCVMLDGLGETLASIGRVVRLSAQDANLGSLFARLAAQLGLNPDHASAPALAAQLGYINTFILYAADAQGRPEDFEQLRQLNNVQPQGGAHLGIVLCGPRGLERLLPGALRQRINAVYHLNENSGNQLLRRLIWTAGLAALASLAFLINTSRRLDSPPNLSANTKLSSNLKAGPAITAPEPATPENPRSHIFQTEAEAEAALQAQEASENPAQK